MRLRVSTDSSPSYRPASADPLRIDLGSEYNLWLDVGSAEATFSNLIHDLSRRSSPPTIPFAPHATLLSSSIIGPSASLEDIEYIVADVAHSLSLKRVVCKFDKLEAGEQFFQCVYVKLQKEESEGLLELHSALRKAFGDTSDPEGTSYFPHMSLVYGDLPMEERRKIIEDMYNSREASTLENGHAQVAGISQFEVTDVQIVRTVGKSDEWEIVATVPLGK